MEQIYIIKDRLNEAMSLRNMTASELAKKSGLNKSSISRYLSGENVPRSIAIGKMSKALDVSPAWVLGYDVPMEASKEQAAVKIDVNQLTDTNKARLYAYYEALKDSQNGNT